MEIGLLPSLRPAWDLLTSLSWRVPGPGTWVWGVENSQLSLELADAAAAMGFESWDFEQDWLLGAFVFEHIEACLEVTGDL